MSFVERALARVGLGEILPARRRGDSVRIDPNTDLLHLGAIADVIRVEEVGDVVRVHHDAPTSVLWIREAQSELDLVRAVALARITGPRHARIGVDWGTHGLEIAQAALGFGASDLTGPITRKSGALISESELKKVKGQGMVAATALKKREISALLANAGRTCVFTDEENKPEHAIHA